MYLCVACQPPVVGKIIFLCAHAGLLSSQEMHEPFLRHIEKEEPSSKKPLMKIRTCEHVHQLKSSEMERCRSDSLTTCSNSLRQVELSATPLDETSREQVQALSPFSSSLAVLLKSLLSFFFSIEISSFSVLFC